MRGLGHVNCRASTLGAEQRLALLAMLADAMSQHGEGDEVKNATRYTISKRASMAWLAERNVQGKGGHGNDGKDDVVVEQVGVAVVGVERGEGAKGSGIEAHGKQLGDDHGDVVVDEGQRVDGDEVVANDADIPGGLGNGG